MNTITMTGAGRKLLAVAACAATFGLTGAATPASALGSTPRGTRPATATGTSGCAGAQVKVRVHDEALRREATLANLVTKLQARRDPFAMNGPQISALQSASAGITALDGQIASTCYPTLAALRADAKKLFVDYRVYWLRGPQTHAIEAADRLAEARARLGDAAAKLAPLVGSNATAQGDLAAMNQALAAADAKLGTAPTAGPALAPVPGLAPSADMSSDTAALRAARTDLLAVRAALATARADGLKVVTDLHG